MKKLIVIFSVVLFSLSGIARDLGASWVATSEGKLDCKRIHIGYNKARIVLENGEKKILPVDLISSYTLNGKVFTKLPLNKNGKSTSQMAFMELISACYDFNLYKYEYINTNLWGKVTCYYLYNGDKLHLALDEKSLSNISDHFGLVVSYK